MAKADGEVYSGSSVHEISLSRYPGILILSTGTGVSFDFKGEAVAVDIADRGTLFVLLTGTRSNPNEPFSPEYGYNGNAEQLANVVFDVRASSAEAVRTLPDRVINGEVPFNQLPMMVRFEDVTDPPTVALVNPYDLAASFGEGINLRRVFVQTTKANVTEGISDRLPWLANQRGSLRPNLRGSILRGIYDGSFRIGFRQ